MTDIDRIRAEAERLTKIANEKQAELERAAARASAMSPAMRAAELLHDEFTSHYGGGSEDPWYYEIPSGAGADELWKQAWSGSEHIKFVNLAHDIAITAFGYQPIGDIAMRHVSMQDMTRVEEVLRHIAVLIGRHNTVGASQRKSVEYDKRSVETLRKTAHQHIDYTIDEALKIMPVLL